MTPYREFLAELEKNVDESYRDFNKRLLKNEKINVLGVRVPVLRKIAKKYVCEIDNLLSFPDEFYEVTFVKLSAAALLKYDEFIKYVDRCVPLIDNWASCDSFSPKCIAERRGDFLPYVRKYASIDGEFYQRFALTTLLSFYADDENAETIFSIAERCNTGYYYVHTAVAWLIAEMLVVSYDKAKSFLMDNSLDKKTHNKAIQKACESFRLSNDRKNFLKGLKR